VEAKEGISFIWSQLHRQQLPLAILSCCFNLIIAPAVYAAAEGTLERRYAYAIGVLACDVGAYGLLVCCCFSAGALLIYCSRHNQSNSHDPGSLAADGNYHPDNDCSGSSFLPEAGYGSPAESPGASGRFGLIGQVSILTATSKPSTTN